ncbi:GIY-YIG nuclease family protein [Nocardia salmonicida]|uniref:GIY-YIG nuclease family protein n=1 Tax=Nocardia salmonicida TaxID=53431 RepID=UPI002E2B3C3E|nr:GIY-YIG nuclease family protein [Nocardia salmonicida]
MGFVYAFRLGRENLFKIGQTTMTPDKRRSSLQTSCPHELALFDAIETDEHQALEKYIKVMWSDDRSDEGGTEIYHLAESQVTEVFATCRRWLDKELPDQKLAQELEQAEPESTILPRNERAAELRRDWLELDRKQRDIRTALEWLGAEKAIVETELKLAIGTSSGIEGVATWAQTRETRRVSPELVKAADPELFEQCLQPRFEAARLKAALKLTGQYTYESFQEVRRSREFRITDDEQPAA